MKIAEDEVCEYDECSVSDGTGGGVAASVVLEFWDDITGSLWGSTNTMLELPILAMILLESIMWEILLLIGFLIKTESELFL